MASAHKSIFAALAANLLIAITKFISGSVTNSAAMISEGVHSLVDTTNQLLLLFGIYRSKKPPDDKRPFGYGKELYFWSFIVSILIFGLGGGISIYQGYIHLRRPEPFENPFWNYIVLAVSFVFESSSFIVAAREFNKTRGELSWWKAIRESKDPSSFLVLFEDGAAILGLAVVFIFVWLGHRLNNPYLDGAASIVVGLILTVVSVLVARESRSLLMGEGIALATQQKITRLVEQDAAVIKLLSVFSTYQSPDEVMLLLIVGFKADLDTEEIDEAINRLRQAIKKEYPRIRYIIIQPEFHESMAMGNKQT
jgi:cation diffusion facilitator family transporter